MSTAFSGIDAPGPAPTMLNKCLYDVLRAEVAHIPHTSAVEWNNDCLAELASHPNPPHHLYMDMTSFFTDAIKHKIASFEQQKVIVTINDFEDALAHEAKNIVTLAAPAKPTPRAGPRVTAGSREQPYTSLEHHA